MISRQRIPTSKFNVCAQHVYNSEKIIKLWTRFSQNTVIYDVPDDFKNNLKRPTTFYKIIKMAMQC